MLMLFKIQPISVWSDAAIRDALSWYYDVLRKIKPAKYLICKSIRSEIDLKNASLEDLWREHEWLGRVFNTKWEHANSGNIENLDSKNNNFLDLKLEIANRCLERCNFCEWICNVDRTKGQVGVCKLDNTSRVASWFKHFGEEAPIVNNQGSGTIFFSGCMFRCVFCQNWDISQFPLAGEEVDGRRLGDIMKRLCEQGAQNINFVGGEPTPNIHTILSGMTHLDENIAMLWNSDMYATKEAMSLLLHVIDIWLPDFKYGNNACARRLSNVPKYFEIISRNHKILSEANTDVIIRHLVMPNHIECCSKPILRWIAENCDRVLVNIMGQYRPDYKVIKNPQIYGDIARTLRQEELDEVNSYAKKLGIKFESISR